MGCGDRTSLLTRDTASVKIHPCLRVCYQASTASDESESFDPFDYQQHPLSSSLSFGSATAMPTLKKSVSFNDRIDRATFQPSQSVSSMHSVMKNRRKRARKRDERQRQAGAAGGGRRRCRSTGSISMDDDDDYRPTNSTVRAVNTGCAGAGGVVNTGSIGAGQTAGCASYGSVNDVDDDGGIEIHEHGDDDDEEDLLNEAPDDMRTSKKGFCHHDYGTKPTVGSADADDVVDDKNTVARGCCDTD